MGKNIIQDEDIKTFQDIMEEFKGLQDTEYDKAYELHKVALSAYDRWSTILFETRQAEWKGKDPALKERIKQVLDMLDKVYTSARMVWGRSKTDYDNKSRY